MFKKGKKLIVLSGLVLGALTTQTAYAETLYLHYDGITHEYINEPIAIEINGSPLTGLSMPPVSIGGRTLVPAKEVFEAMGATVDWKGAAKEVYIQYEENELVLKIDDSTAKVNGRSVTLEVPAKIINAKTMIPIRVIAEELGFTVGWNDPSRIVSIAEKEVVVVDTEDEEIIVSIPGEEGFSGSGSTDNTVQEPETIDALVQNLIQPQNHSAITVTNLYTPGVKDPQVFTIETSGSVSSVDAFSLDGRIVVDIANSSNGLGSEMAVDSPYVTAVRTSQHQDTVTRVVFDLAGDTECTITTGADRKNIVVQFQKNNITEVSHQSNGANDTITITGQVAPAVQMQRLRNPLRVVLEVPYAEANFNPLAESIQTQRIAGVQTEIEDDVIRLTVTIEDRTNISVSEAGNKTVISFLEAGYNHIAYENENGALWLIEKTDGVSVENISFSDQYRSRQGVFTLPGNYSGFYGNGDMLIEDGIVEKISVINDNGQTQFVVQTNGVNAFQMADLGDHIGVYVKNPKEVYNAVIIIDPGHGGNDPGASGNGLVEKTIALDIGLKVIQLLENDPDVKVYATRDDDTYPSWNDRTALYNGAADMFVSIHLNSFGTATPQGTEVLYIDDSSWYSPGVLNSLVMAQTMQNRIIEATGNVSRGIKSRPDLIVLNRTSMPSILIETGFLSNPTDAANLGDNEFRQKLADTIYQTLKELVNTYPYR